ncbi:hypothetical protein IKQ65_02345 [Candidatus Saccharibacteria bacterium]|nr:hypothetical protein [Candidatus Saccharibacteria bacterium]MBR6961958.1 hypothetical protein [Candidatus Saccharibacteria bacterium]
MLTANHRTAKTIKKKFYLPPIRIATALREEQATRRNHSAKGDAYVISLYREIDGITCPSRLVQGYFPFDSQDEAEKVHRSRIWDALNDVMDGRAKDAAFHIGKDNDRKDLSTSHVCTLFVRSDDGFIGITWRNQVGTSQDALIMCAFMAYILGRINENDSALSESSQLLEDAALEYAESGIFNKSVWDWEKEKRAIEI